MKYNQSDIERVKAAADIRDFVPDLKGSGTSRYCACPKCGKSGKNKGLIVTHKANMDLAKCFSCDFTLNGAIDAVMFFQKVKYPEAVKVVADRCGIHLQTEAEKKKLAVRSAGKSLDGSFCARQLAASGLTVADVMATVHLSDSARTQVETSPFVKGGVDAYWNVNKNDDEMLILYYDLWGNRVQYATRGIAGKLRDYVRVRWSNPELHLDGSGRPIKYQTPKGAQTKFYIPQYVRACFQQGRQIDTLVIQEGEKKAEKACKHHIPSIGIQGIYNIGNEQSGLIKDLQYLVQTCRIRNVVLMLDSDWDHLHRSLSAGDHIDQRPNQFAKAVIKFKQYVLTMHNLGVSVDVFFGHIKENGNRDKGIDDLLVNTLAGKEDLLKRDIEQTLFSHNGIGEYVDIFKISAKSDFQIKDYWLLNDRDAFFRRHKDEIGDISAFRFGHVSYRVDNGKLVQASRYNVEREFWSVRENDKGKKTVNFEYIDAFQFINANGFYRIRTADCDFETGQYKFVRIDGGVVSLSSPTEIRDFVYSYALQTVKDRDVLTMLASKLGTLLGSDKLERLDRIDDNFDTFEPHVQRLFFRNGCLSVTAREIAFGNIVDNVWSDRVIRRSFKRVPLISEITYSPAEGFGLKTTPDACRCEFFRFILNVSNFWNRPGYAMTAADAKEFYQHVVNKITAIGFLLTDFKYQTELKAVIAMDGQMGDVGQSNGRSGKSLVGVALSKMLEQAVIDGRSTKNDAEYIYSSVTLRTRNIFIDDVRVNFDFGKFFAAVTGDLQVNPKTKARFTIPNERSPKIYITTNHAINAQDRSSVERIIYMSFSDWYNDTHRPVDDFGHQFFVDWDEEQWNLFDNFMAECCMFYFVSMANEWYRAGQGAVPPPMDDIRLRTLKQRMGEAFFQWAEIYFDPSALNLNTRVERKAMYDAFHTAFPDARLSVTPTNFKSKVLLYCEFKGFHFNINRPNKDGAGFAEFSQRCPDGLFVGEMDKSGGKEYFTVSSKDFSSRQPF